MKRITSVAAARRLAARTARFPVLRALVAAALTFAAIGVASAQSTRPDAVPDQYARGRVLVQPRVGLSAAEFDKAIREHSGRRGHLLRQINVHVIELPQTANSVAVAQALQRSRKFKFVEVDGALPPAYVPNDPQYVSAWHLPKIGAPAAWDKATGTGATIAILDTGIDLAHPDLKSQLVPGWNFYNGNDNVADVHGHGTAVAGVAAAAGNNGLGVSSVSFQSKIMPMRVTDPEGYGYFSMMADAINRAADNGARVANLSFLGVSTSSTVASAAQYMRSKGGVVVIAGGNTGALRTDPPSTVFTSVSATDSADARASFSSYGDYIDLAAPGVSILTTMRGGGYGGFSGTSASSPVVAGVYGLLISAKPTLTSAALDNIVFTTAQDLGAAGLDQQFGYGRVNAAAAITKALQTTTTDSQPPSVVITFPTGGPISGIAPIDVYATDNVAVARTELYINGTLTATDTLAPYGYAIDTVNYTEGQQLVLLAKAIDTAGNVASSSTVTVTVTNDTEPPTVAIVNPLAGSTVSGTVPVSVSAADNKKVAKITLTIDGKDVAVAYGPSLTYSWNATGTKGKGGGGGKNQTSGTSSTLKARAEDVAGNAAQATVSVIKK